MSKCCRLGEARWRQTSIASRSGRRRRLGQTRNRDRSTLTRRTPSTPCRRGEHVVVVTGTASGKSLCYHDPGSGGAPGQILRPRRSTMFPTKALAQDQLGVCCASRSPIGVSPRRRHLRRRHAATYPYVRSAEKGNCRPHQSRHAPLGHPASTYQLGAILRQPALRRLRRAPHLPRHLRFARRQRAPATDAHRRSLRVRRRSSSPAPPRSPTPASTPKRLTGVAVHSRRR